MTSATAPSPYVIKSSYNEASYQNYYIFDKTSSGWLVRGAITETSDAWFSIDVGNINNTFYSYSVFGNADNSTGDFPKRWNLYVSNEDTTTPVDWILIDTVNRYISGAYNILFQV
jgi:hypothetical protein